MADRIYHALNIGRKQTQKVLYRLCWGAAYSMRFYQCVHQNKFAQLILGCLDHS